MSPWPFGVINSVIIPFFMKVFSLITKHFASKFGFRTFVSFLFRGFGRPPCKIPLQVSLNLFISSLQWYINLKANKQKYEKGLEKKALSLYKFLSLQVQFLLRSADKVGIPFCFSSVFYYYSFIKVCRQSRKTFLFLFCFLFLMFLTLVGNLSVFVLTFIILYSFFFSFFFNFIVSRYLHQFFMDFLQIFRVRWYGMDNGICVILNDSLQG